MEMCEIREIAKGHGIVAGKMEKTELISVIQIAEGYEPCFNAGISASCSEKNCLWRGNCGLGAPISDFQHGLYPDGTFFSFDFKEKKTSNRSLLSRIQTAVETRKPALARIISDFGGESLGNYAGEFRVVSEGETIQPRQDVIDVAAAYAGRLLGADIAEKLEKQLLASPVLMTANHHGPDYLNITVQGKIVFALGEDYDGIMPVFAFGNIPLNNLVYGRGIRLAGGTHISIYPERMKHSMVASTIPFDAGMIDNGKKLAENAAITNSERLAVLQVLADVYRDKAVLSQKSFADQAVVMNRKIWDLMFTPQARQQMPDIAYLEMEDVVVNLLKMDIINPNSLIYRILFDKALRGKVLEELDGVYGCWNMEKLARMSRPSTTASDRSELLKGSGTIFFWGINDKGGRVPLGLQHDNDGEPILSGRDDSGNTFAYKFTPESVLLNILEKRLLPSMFTCFASVAFARGFKCYGAFMQVQYLTEMALGLAAALEVYDSAWATAVRRVPTANYTAGMFAVVARYPDGSIKPAGAIEIIAKGGLTEKDIDDIRQLNVSCANSLGLPGMYKIVYRDNEQSSELLAITELDIYREVGSRMVEIELT
jgi:hypothetical protein